LYLETAIVEDMKDTAVVVVIEMTEGMKIAINMLKGSIKFDSSLIGLLSMMKVKVKQYNQSQCLNLTPPPTQHIFR
jgi:hypothetical protein